MDINIVPFIWFCVMYAQSLCAGPEGLAIPKLEEILLLLEECLVVAIFLHDTRLQMTIYTILGGMYRNMSAVYLSLGKYYQAIEYNDKRIDIAKKVGDKDGEGRSYGNLAYAYQALGEYHKAIEYNEKRLTISEEIGDKEGEEHSYMNLGVAYRSLGEYHKAVEYHEKGLEIAKEIGDRRGEGNFYGNLGVVYKSLGEYHKAIHYHENHLRIAKEIGDRQGEVNSYMNLGNTYLSLEEYRNVIDCHEKRIEIVSEIHDQKGEEYSYAMLGIAYGALDEYHKALECHEKHLRIAKEIGDRRGEGNSYGNLGNTYKSLGKHQDAIGYHEKSLEVAKEIGNRRGEGMCYISLGSVYRSIGEYQKAIEYHELSLIIAKEIGDRKEEGSSYLGMGASYHLLGEYHNAIKYNKMSLVIAAEIGDKIGEEASYEGLGNAYLSMEEYHQAIECYKKSLDIAERTGSRRGKEPAYANLGNVYRSLGEYHKAIESYKKSLDIAKEIRNRQGEGRAYGNLGSVYQILGEHQTAMEYHEKTLDIVKEIGDKQGEAIAHNNIGLCYQEETSIKDLRKSKEHLENSIECYEKLFDDLKENDQFKISIVDTFIITYKALNQVLIERGDIDKALLVCERGRARALGDLLSYKYSTTNITKNAKVKKQTLDLVDIKTILSSCDSCILFYNLRTKFSSDVWVVGPQARSIYFYDELTKREDLKKIFNSEKYVDDIKNIENDYFQNLVHNSFESMKIRESMKCEDRSLESFEYEDNDEDFSKTASNSKKTDMNDKSLRWGEAVCDEIDEAIPLEILFDRLVDPVLHTLTQDEIIIIPDGPLFMLPFAALQDPKTGKFLSETKRIRLAPSLTTLKILQESSDENYSKSGALIIGNPATGKVMYKGKQRSITSLPGAENEAKEIGKLLGVQSLIGEHATKDKVLRHLEHGVSVIHFAAHGCEENGQIFLAPSKPSTTNNIPEENEYILTMKEAQDSGIRAQLVVLSCCHTGRGEIKSEGVVGMTRAFLAAGARSVVASLWAIADEATMLFMVKFYSHLKNGESASTSLQQAMKEMRETEKYKEPKYWAAFFLIGDDVTITV